MLTNEELNNKIRELKQLQAHEKDLNAQIGKLKEDIQKDMDERNLEEYNTTVYNIFWRLVERRDVDKKKLEKDGLLEKYLKVSCYPKLDIR
jgi:hypothetical protein